MSEPINKREQSATPRRRQEVRIWCIVGLLFLIHIAIIMDLLQLVSGMFTAIAIVLMLCLACFIGGRIFEAKKIYG